jgi:GT2 family glycosyltransferase
VSAAEPAPEVGVVIATRDRRDSLLRTLAEIQALPERPPTVVVDNASSDGTTAVVSSAFPAVELIGLERNRGAFARNLGAARLRTPFVAFSDDDSWWRPGALPRAAATLRHHAAVGLLAARILVGPERRPDPTSALMAAGPTSAGLPGPRVDGFLACGAVVRREAFLAAGGFCERYLIGAEEALLTIDLRAAGWELCYAAEVTAIHEPHGASRGDRPWLRLRNDLWTSWLRLPAGRALRDTAALAAAATHDSAARRALISAAAGLPWALGARRVPSG